MELLAEILGGVQGNSRATNCSQSSQTIKPNSESSNLWGSWGTLLDPFYRDLDAKFIKKGKRTGRSRHLGIDVQARRGSPVYATLRPDVSIEKLNRYSLGISGQGWQPYNMPKYSLGVFHGTDNPGIWRSSDSCLCIQLQET